MDQAIPDPDSLTEFFIGDIRTCMSDGSLSSWEDKHILKYEHTLPKNITPKILKDSRSEDSLCEHCCKLANDVLPGIQLNELLDDQVLVIRLGDLLSFSDCKSCEYFASSLDPPLFSGTPFYLISLATDILGLTSTTRRLSVVTYAVWSDLSQVIDEPGNGHFDSLISLISTPNDDNLMEADSRQLDQQDYECISRWLADCHENHVSTCPPHTAQRSIQLSFIDCHNAVVVLTPFDASYLALSYVWDVPTHLGVGNTSHQTLLNAPMVIKDAMEVTIRLGYQYLWVDRYCINQDDAEEKYRQINHMNYIYAGAEVTIVAAADMSIVGGLQGVSSRTNSLDSGFRLGPYLHTLVPVPRLAIKRSKWNSRGWTYQEAVLSPRKLVFTTHHIYMQCNGKHAFVSHSPNGQKYTFPPHDNFTGQFKNHQVAMMALESNPYPESHFGRTNVELFNSHIKEYVVRELSFESDRFNAIRGVLSHFETQHPPVFQIYGLPYLTDSSYLINSSLSWETDPLDQDRQSDFPSWSWLSASKVPSKDTLFLNCSPITSDSTQAKISVKINGERTVCLTHAETSSEHGFDLPIPVNAKISPVLIIQAAILPFPLEKKAYGEWGYRSGLRCPFSPNRMIRGEHIRMGLDRNKDLEKGGRFNPSKVKAIVLGCNGFYVVQMLMVHRINQDWERVGTATYSYYGEADCYKRYLRTMKKLKRRTIRLR